MNEKKKPVYRNGTRITPFMDPRTCPRCLDRATVVFGARGYCCRCRDELSAFVRAQEAV
jgi:hypothetical protein